MRVSALLSSSRHGVWYFRFPIPVTLHPQHRRSDVKVSLRTRDPGEALRLARWFGQIAGAVTERGALIGMRYDEIRAALRKHFERLLADHKAQIAERGRLGVLDRQALANGGAFAHQALQDGTGAPGLAWDDAEVDRLASHLGLSLKPQSADFATLRAEAQRAYREYCQAVLDYDRSLDSFDLTGTADRPHPATTRADMHAPAPVKTLKEVADGYIKDSELGERWTTKTKAAALVLGVSHAGFSPPKV
ncbi:MAG TPA: DUF6538 domain-containing protein [Dongiaceae bacterium]|nr:DUF6538 domain-containing protein [Dongiaceae bacterium]